MVNLSIENFSFPPPWPDWPAWRCEDHRQAKQHEGKSHNSRTGSQAGQRGTVTYHQLTFCGTEERWNYYWGQRSCKEHCLIVWYYVFEFGVIDKEVWKNHTNISTSVMGPVLLYKCIIFHSTPVLDPCKSLSTCPSGRGSLLCRVLRTDPAGLKGGVWWGHHHHPDAKEEEEEGPEERPVAWLSSLLSHHMTEGHTKW